MKIKAYRIINVTIVLYGCQTWSPLFREKRRLRVFEKRVLSRMFIPKTDEVNRGLEKTTQ